ncbi:MAG: hypothetical protein ABI867_29355 [Kofleriaceae bacterium]
MGTSKTVRVGDQAMRVYVAGPQDARTGVIVVFYGGLDRQFEYA